ncbi:immunoglobulin-like domain-containing protein [Oerskovia paurometabola]|uniref:Immunoglobulin-like domain-containing protein n=1 Tax=Oerskovia paurometabola TaxID=162170 RepID=A0ABW1X7S8_9CELL|nr:immunoglobulin-like domain-containing protein [Oerskovia paurometabola]MBM7496327.1 hypothetical protein [Oerskovia paurometabola]
MRRTRGRLVAASVAVALSTGLTTTAVAAADPALPEAGLVAWYKLDEASGTSAANSAPGSTFGAATVVGAARSANGITLDGTDDHVRLPDSLLKNLTSVTVDLDVLVDTAQATPYFIWGMGNTSGSNGNGYLFTTGNAYRTGIASGNWSTEQNTTKGTNLARGVWKHLTYTQTGTTGTLYEDGVQVAQNTAVTTTPGSIGAGTTTANYIGRSLYSGDKYLKGQVRDFRVYDRALPANDVADLAQKTSAAAAGADAAALDLGDTSAVTSNLTLPVTGAQGSTIAWTTSHADVVTSSGKVTQPAAGRPAASVTLTASVTRGAVTLPRAFTVVVPPALDDAQAAAWDAQHAVVTNIADVRGNLTLPTKGAQGSTLTWTSSAPGTVSDTGVVHRPVHGAGDTEVTLTVTATKGTATSTQPRTATVRQAPEAQEPAAYFFPYFKGESTADGEEIYFAASQGNDPLKWQELNDDKTVLHSGLGEKGLRDPFVIRSPEGDKFFLVATDLKIYGGNNFGNAQERGSLSLMVWESTDLVSWSDQRMVKVSSDYAGNTWAPEAFYDEAAGEYVVYWASALYPTTDSSDRKIATSYQRMMYATTRDFVTFSEPRIWVDNKRGTGLGIIDASVTRVGDTYYRFIKDEKYMTVRSEKSTDLRATSWDLITENIGVGQPNGYGGTFTAGEGPTVFKSNTEEKWYVFMDQPSYHGGKGYVPFESTDLDSGVWTKSEPATLPVSPRHGTVLPVTQAEYDRLLAHYQPDAFVASAAPVTVTTAAGTAPVLPATVAATYGDGATKDLAVTWDAVDPASWAQAGTFAVSGSFGPSITTRAAATVTVTAPVDPEPDPDLAVEVSATAKCVAGKVAVSVRAVNHEDVPVDLKATSPFGSKTFTGVAPGRSASQAFATREGSVAEGVVTITASTTGASPVTATIEASYPALACG